jgi:hypothetical protein
VAKMLLRRIADGAPPPAATRAAVTGVATDGSGVVAVGRFAVATGGDAAGRVVGHVDSEGVVRSFEGEVICTVAKVRIGICSAAFCGCAVGQLWACLALRKACL